MSRSILSRARNYYLHGANDLVHVTRVTVPDERVREAERVAHERYREETQRTHDRETFETLPTERDIEILRMIGREFDELCILRSTLQATDAGMSCATIHPLKLSRMRTNSSLYRWSANSGAGGSRQ
ncbi:hypothetical protein B0G76_7460 [Paraburkholderia sp. BL23I1N1]|nr:hypothetical protein B0G76_7460 [Paraburkholderia sp. BL23I1N1]